MGFAGAAAEHEPEHGAAAPQRVSNGFQPLRRPWLNHGRIVAQSFQAASHATRR